MGEMWLSGDAGLRTGSCLVRALVAHATPAALHSSGTWPLRHWSDCSEGKQSVGIPDDAMVDGCLQCLARVVGRSKGQSYWSTIR